MNLKRKQECEVFLVRVSIWEQAWNSLSETPVRILALFLTSYWIGQCGVGGLLNLLQHWFPYMYKAEVISIVIFSQSN